MRVTMSKQYEYWADVLRKKQDYCSGKWSTYRMVSTPPLHRSHLTDTIALRFRGSQRERWQEMCASATITSTMAPDPDRESPPSSQQKREVHVQNRASFLRMRSCPPNYILNPRYYKRIIERNNRFALESKKIAVSPKRMPDGESFRSFLLGARYSDMRSVEARVMYRCGYGNRPQEPLATRSRSTSPSTGRRSPTSSQKQNMDAPKKSYTSGNYQGDSHSQAIAVHGSNHCYSRPLERDEKSSHGGSSSATLSPTLARPGTPEIRIFQHESERDLNTIETAAMKELVEENSATTVNAEQSEIIENTSQQKQEQQEQPQSDGDFISPEAQKLTGDILKELEVDETETGSHNKEEATQAEEVVVPEAAANRERAGSITKMLHLPRHSTSPIEPRRAAGVGDATTDDDDAGGKSPELDKEELEKAVANLVSLPSEQEISASMASKSSTIFVDMSNLSLQQQEADSPNTA